MGYGGLPSGNFIECDSALYYSIILLFRVTVLLEYFNLILKAAIGALSGVKGKIPKLLLLLVALEIPLKEYIAVASRFWLSASVRCRKTVANSQEKSIIFK